MTRNYFQWKLQYLICTLYNSLQLIIIFKLHVMLNSDFSLNLFNTKFDICFSLLKFTCNCSNDLLVKVLQPFTRQLFLWIEDTQHWACYLHRTAPYPVCNFWKLNKKTKWFIAECKDCFSGEAVKCKASWQNFMVSQKTFFVVVIEKN